MNQNCYILLSVWIIAQQCDVGLSRDLHSKIHPLYRVAQKHNYESITLFLCSFSSISPLCN